MFETTVDRRAVNESTALPPPPPTVLPRTPPRSERMLPAALGALPLSGAAELKEPKLALRKWPAAVRSSVPSDKLRPSDPREMVGELGAASVEICGAAASEGWAESEDSRLGRRLGRVTSERRDDLDDALRSCFGYRGL